jgi:dTDP-4-dehydrorhamnose 3,5-epimerase
MSAAIENGTTILIPVCDPGIGEIITSPDSPNLIDGVGTEAGALWPDDRGWFQEIFRAEKGLFRSYSLRSTQVSAAVSYPGIIKAFHYHRHQTDYWTPITGAFQVALVDLRPESPTFGVKNTMYVGEHRPWRILIPPGVAHGYKVVTPTSGVLVYATDRFYDPSDEGRIPHDHPEINYSWATQHK